MKDSSQTGRFWSLDIVRGLSILAVIGFHVLPSPDTESALIDPSTIWINWLRYGGTLGVSVFFVLSGFSVHLSLARKLAAKPDLQPEWSKFFRRRLGRLYPAYLGAIALSVALSFTWALIKRRDFFAYLPGVWDFLSHLLLLHTLNPETFFGIIPALWFVGVLAHLYLLYPVFFVLNQRWDINRALLVVLICTLTCRLASQILSLTLVDDKLQMMLWYNAPQRWFEWCMGAWTAQKVARGTRLQRNYIWLLLLLIILWLPVGSEFRLVYEPLLGCLIAFTLWSLVTLESYLGYNSWLLPIFYLGRISYPVYLLHQIFIPYIRSALAPLPINVVSMYILLGVIVLILTIILTVLFHRFLELSVSNPQTKPHS